MAYDKGPTLPSSRIEDADFTNARLHAPSFEGAKITDGWFVNADISADIEGLRLNGVVVAPLIQAELERLFPERTKLRATDPAGIADAWSMLDKTWNDTFARAATLPESLLAESVDDEWSFIETQRHLVMATDCWLRRMVKGIERPYHPWGMAGSWLADPASWGLDTEATPSAEEIVAVRRERMAEIRATIDALTESELARECVPPQTLGHPTRPHSVLHCIHVILNEEYEHNRYAVRDLDILTS